MWPDARPCWMRALIACCVWSIRGVLVPCAMTGENPSPTNKADANNETVKSLDFIGFPNFVDELKEFIVALHRLTPCRTSRDLPGIDGATAGRAGCSHGANQRQRHSSGRRSCR